ncbi:hypothetical protein PWT90_05937 [Aphanocladium album]|nr:hypothetical protein PWT90_05937 [Aphanocladium album]
MAEMALFPAEFKEFSCTTQDEPQVIIHGIASGDASTSSLPPLLLIHGFPQTHHMWHRVAPELASRFTVIIPDIRGYGKSSKPTGVANYAKSVMARDMISVMDQLGYAGKPFPVIGHDRGGRITHKMLVDHPDRITAAILLDISPTLRIFGNLDQHIARAFDHWFFLIQPAPFPETLLNAHPQLFLDKWMLKHVLGALESRFDQRCLDVYAAGLADPETARGMCDDYRAAYEFDTVEQQADKDAGRLITRPLQVLWAEDGAVGATMNCLQDWQDAVEPSIKVTGQAVSGSHFIPEENAGAVIDAALGMFV